MGKSYKSRHNGQNERSYACLYYSMAINFKHYRFFLRLSTQKESTDFYKFVMASRLMYRFPFSTAQCTAQYTTTTYQFNIRQKKNTKKKRKAISIFFPFFIIVFVRIYRRRRNVFHFFPADEMRTKKNPILCSHHSKPSESSAFYVYAV